MTDPTIVRVTGHACLPATSDSAQFTITVHRSAATAAGARRSGTSALTSVERALDSHSVVVRDRYPGALDVHVHDEKACGTAQLVVVAGIGEPLSGLLVALRKVRGVQLSEPAYGCRDIERPRHFARKAAIADATAAARSIAETLNREVGAPDWVSDTGAPAVVVTDASAASIEFSVTAQFTLREPEQQPAQP